MKTFFILTSLLLLVNCKSYNQQDIYISQVETDLSLILTKNKRTNQLRLLQIPIRVKVKNNSSEEDNIVSIDYNYNRYKGLGGSLLFELRENSLIKKSNEQKKKILPDNSISFVVYSSHFIEKDSDLISALEVYKIKMNSLKQDTLAFGSLKEFKNTFPKIVNKLLQGDSVSLHYRDKSTKDFIVKTIPVQF